MWHRVENKTLLRIFVLCKVYCKLLLFLVDRLSFFVSVSWCGCVCNVSFDRVFSNKTLNNLRLRYIVTVELKQKDKLNIAIIIGRNCIIFWKDIETCAWLWVGINMMNMRENQRISGFRKQPNLFGLSFFFVFGFNYYIGLDIFSQLTRRRCMWLGKTSQTKWMNLIFADKRLKKKQKTKRWQYFLKNNCPVLRISFDRCQQTFSPKPTACNSARGRFKSD